LFKEFVGETETENEACRRNVCHQAESGRTDCHEVMSAMGGSCLCFSETVRQIEASAVVTKLT
jgi:hypothetical protein